MKWTYKVSPNSLHHVGMLTRVPDVPTSFWEAAGTRRLRECLYGIWKVRALTTPLAGRRYVPTSSTRAVRTQGGQRMGARGCEIYVPSCSPAIRPYAAHDVRMEENGGMQ